MGDATDQKILVEVRAVDAEGARIGIGSCVLCGAALVLDEMNRWDVTERHRQWHADREREAE